MTAQFDQNDSQGQKVIIEDTRVRDLENDATLRPLSLIADRMRDLAAHVHPPVPNPAPLGLIAFGFTVALVMVKHSRIGGEETTEVKGVDSVTMGFALFFGGLLQVIAGLCEVRRNNIFGYTAFCLYGGFWMSLATIQIVPLMAYGEVTPANHTALQAMFSLVTVFTVMLWVLTFKMNKTICVLFFLLTMTVVLLTAGVTNQTVDAVAGYLGIITSANAFWLAFVELYNDIFGGGAEVIPLGHWKANSFQSTGGVHSPGRIHGHLPFIVRRLSRKRKNEENPESDGVTSSMEQEPEALRHLSQNPSNGFL